MAAFSHVTLGTNDIDESRRFYDAVLQTLGWIRLGDFDDFGSMWGDGRPSLFVQRTSDGRPADPGHGTTVAFEASTRSSARAFYAVAIAFGSPREIDLADQLHTPNCFAGYTRDPAGNRIAIYCFNPD